MNQPVIEISGLRTDVVLARQKSRGDRGQASPRRRIKSALRRRFHEIARNTFQYGGGGTAEFSIEENPEKMLLVTLRDQGRGIGNLDEIMGGMCTYPRRAWDWESSGPSA